MTLHKFASGQIVEFGGSVPSILKPKGPCEVVGVLPVDETNAPTYRVKSETELFARSAREIDLVAIGAPPAQREGAAQWAHLLSGHSRSRPLRSR